MKTIENVPGGVYNPSGTERKTLWRAYSGDTLKMRVRAYHLDDYASKSDYDLEFVLSNQRFSPYYEAIWVGTWGDGIEEVDPTSHPGLVEISIPQSISDTLERGGYIFSLSATRKSDGNVQTSLVGHLLIEYAPHSPTHEIPY